MTKMSSSAKFAGLSGRVTSTTGRAPSSGLFRTAEPIIGGVTSTTTVAVSPLTRVVTTQKGSGSLSVRITTRPALPRGSTSIK